MLTPTRDHRFSVMLDTGFRVGGQTVRRLHEMVNDKKRTRAITLREWLRELGLRDE